MNTRKLLLKINGTLNHSLYRIKIFNYQSLFDILSAIHHFCVQTSESRDAPFLLGRKSQEKDQAATALITVWSHNKEVIIFPYPSTLPLLHIESLLRDHSARYQTKPVGSTGSLTENELLFNGNPPEAGEVQIGGREGKFRDGGSYYGVASRGANFIEIDYRSCLLRPSVLLPFAHTPLPIEGTIRMLLFPRVLIQLEPARF